MDSRPLLYSDAAEDVHKIFLCIEISGTEKKRLIFNFPIYLLEIEDIFLQENASIFLGTAIQ